MTQIAHRAPTRNHPRKWLHAASSSIGDSHEGDSRLHTVVDDRHHSYYAYDHAGERTLKVTGHSHQLDVNADLMHTAAGLDEFTLYPSPYLVFTNRGYTKHYYAGSERLAARIGGGFDRAILREQTDIAMTATHLFKQSQHHTNDRHLNAPPAHTIRRDHLSENIYRAITKEFEAPMHLVTDAVIKSNNLISTAQNIVAGNAEPDVYFYHSDHLGSASWITDGAGIPVQHLLYLPYGEPFVNQRVGGYNERFTFTGKERDEETGFGYFGARYMDHELMTMWLSVDPLSDKYPSISPYAYCAWNPIRLIDPDGMDIWDLNSEGELIWREASENDRIYAQNGSYVDMDEGVLTRGKSYTKDTKGFLLHLGNDGEQADKIFEFFADNAGVEFSLIGYANTPEDKCSENFTLTTSFDAEGDIYGSYFSEAKSKMGTLRDHTHNHPDGDIWPSGIPSQEGIALGTWNPEEKGNDSRFVAAMRKNLKDSNSKGVFQAYIYCPRNSKKRAFPGGYRCYTKGEKQGAKYRKNASSRYSR